VKPNHATHYRGVVHERIIDVQRVTTRDPSLLATTNGAVCDELPASLEDENLSRPHAIRVGGLELDDIAASNPGPHTAPGHAHTHRAGPSEGGARQLRIDRDQTHGSPRHCGIATTLSRWRRLMTSAPRTTWKLAARLLETAAVVDLAVARAQRAYRHFLEGLLPSVLTDAELTELSTRLYYHRRRDPFGHDLFEWERAWFEQHLPTSPGRILVGGAGCGRECAWLRQRGWVVDAYEPSRVAAERCQRVVAPGDGVCVVAAHEDFSDAVLDGRANACTSLGQRSYTAVLLGWGSFSHVLDPKQRARIVEASTRISTGPVLASARLSDQTIAPLRAERLGRAIGLRLGGRDMPFRIQYQPEVGLAATLASAELEEIAHRAHRRVEWRQGPGIAAIVFAA